MNYTEIVNFRTSHQQKQTLQKMKANKVNVSKFMRDAVTEKINNEYLDLIPKPNPPEYSKPTSNVLKQLQQLKKIR